MAPDNDSMPVSALEFRPQCPGCTPSVVTTEGARPCSHYDCPGLPEELRVTCDKCMYDFAADDGQPDCDHNTCESALRLKSHVPMYQRWLQILADEAAASA